MVKPERDPANLHGLRRPAPQPCGTGVSAVTKLDKSGIRPVDCLLIKALDHAVDVVNGDEGSSRDDGHVGKRRVVRVFGS